MLYWLLKKCARGWTSGYSSSVGAHLLPGAVEFPGELLRVVLGEGLRLLRILETHLRRFQKVGYRRQLL